MAATAATKRLEAPYDADAWFQRNKKQGIVIHYPYVFKGSGGKGSDKEHKLSLIYHDGVNPRYYLEEFGSPVYVSDINNTKTWYYVVLSSILRALQFAIVQGYKTIMSNNMKVFEIIHKSADAFETDEERAIWTTIQTTYGTYMGNGGQVIDAVVPLVEYE